MGLPDDRNDAPYGAQTEHNTDPAWLDAGNKEIAVNLDGMHTYASNMVAIRDNLNGHLTYLQPLASVPSQAWQPGALPEGAYAAEKMTRHYGEFMQFFSYLMQGLGNIGSAAQTIAYAYQGTDGWSAADLNAVKFAFGDSAAGAPAGYPPQLPRTTWSQQFSENLAAGNGAASGRIDEWTAQRPFTDASGTHNVATNQDGMTRTITVFTPPYGGATITTTTLTNSSGEVVKTESIRTSYYLNADNAVVKRVTSYDGNHVETGAVDTTTKYGPNGEVTFQQRQNYDAAGTPTTSTQLKTELNGTQTYTTTDSHGNQRVIEIGANTAGIDGTPDSPGLDAINRVKPTN